MTKSEDRSQINLPEQGTPMGRPDTLSQLSITTSEAQRLALFSPEEQRKKLKENLSAYANEVLEDKTVSLPYFYWERNGRLYSDSRRREKDEMSQQFDQREREGLPGKGFEEISSLLMNPENRDRVVLWYSPKGPASFDEKPDESNPYQKINFIYGQLYIHVHDGEKIQSVAVKVSNEQVLSQIDPLLGTIMKTADQKERIKLSLQTPVVLSCSLEEFLGKGYLDFSEEVYTDKRGDIHRLGEVLNELRETYSGHHPATLDRFDKTIDRLDLQNITEQTILQAYLMTVYQQKSERGFYQLMGSCGGAEVSRNDIAVMLGIVEPNLGLSVWNTSVGRQILPSSSAYRLITSSSSTPQKDTDEGYWQKGRCVVCHAEGMVGPCSICQPCAQKM